MKLHELPDGALAEAMHSLAAVEETHTSDRALGRLYGVRAALSAVTGIEDWKINNHLNAVYDTVGARPGGDTKYRIVWERDAIQALRKRVSPLEEVRDA